MTADLEVPAAVSSGLGDCEERWNPHPQGLLGAWDRAAPPDEPLTCGAWHILW